jgi:hypothetical protein
MLYQLTTTVLSANLPRRCYGSTSHLRGVVNADHECAVSSHLVKGLYDSHSLTLREQLLRNAKSFPEVAIASLSQPRGVVETDLRQCIDNGA